jgi:two-component system, NtrC family, sensor kinase
VTSDREGTSAFIPTNLQAKHGAPRWHLIYFLLATLVLLTVSVSLYLNHQILETYNEAVLVNQHWSEHLKIYDELGQLAGDVNAPGNDIFDTRNVAGESQRMRTANVKFQAALAMAREELEHDTNLTEAADLKSDIGNVAIVMDEMVREAELIFSYFAEKQPDKAGERMATMDRKFAQVSAAIAHLRVDVRFIQQTNYDHQHSIANKFRQFEYWTAGFIVLMVIGALFYGQKILKQMRLATRERRRYTVELQNAKEAAEAANS